MASEIVSLGEDALELRTTLSPQALFALAERLAQTGLFDDAWPGISSLAVRFDPLAVPRADAALRLREAAVAVAEEALPTPKTHTIEVRYGGEDGPDLAQAAGALSLSEDALVARHSAAEHEVVLLGFTPGFAYLSGAEGLPLPRLGMPRLRVPAGRVGLAGGRTGLYALDGPGGWPLIGRTKAVLFRDGAPVLRPGDKVRFEPA